MFCWTEAQNGLVGISFLSELTSRRRAEHLRERASERLTQPREFEKMESFVSGTIWKSAVKPDKIYFVSILKMKWKIAAGVFSPMMLHFWAKA